MTHIFDALHEDHERVAKMLVQIGQAAEKDPETVTDLLEEVRRDLETHASFEEAEVYPAIEQAMGEGGELKHAVEEHDEAIQLLEQLTLSVAEGENQEWKERVEDLQAAIEHHVEEEEKEIFPQVRDKLPASQAEQLANEYQVFKEKLAAE